MGDEVRFDEQVVIVTGSGSGLGKAYARELARRGATVVVADNGVSDDGGWRADETVAQIEADGGAAVASITSVTDRREAASLTELALDRFGRLDMLVNNAGVFRYKAFDHVSLEEFDHLVDVNFTGSVNVARPAFQAMMQSGYGRILCTTSTSGLLGMAGYSAYASAKMGLVGLVHVLAQEGLPRNVLCNLISPIARTAMNERIIGAIGPDADPEHAVPMALYLLSQQSRVTREIFSMGAGRFARMFVGLTPGWIAPASLPATVEDVAAHIEQIRATDGYCIPDRGEYEMELLVKMIEARNREK